MSTRRVAVLGLGEFGRALAVELSELGTEVLAVDLSSKKVDAVRDQVASAAIADIRDSEVIRELFATSFDVAVIAIGGNLEASIMATLHLAELNVEEIWAEASSNERAVVLRRVGATKILSPEGDMGRRIAGRIANPNLIEFLPLTKGYGVVEVPAPPSTHDKTLAELDLRRTRNLAVLAVRRDDGTVQAVPGGQTRIGEGDILTLVGKDTDLCEFKDGK